MPSKAGAGSPGLRSTFPASAPAAGRMRTMPTTHAVTVTSVQGRMTTPPRWTRTADTELESSQGRAWLGARVSRAGTWPVENRPAATEDPEKDHERHPGDGPSLMGRD